MNAFSILAIGGLSLLFLSYFSGGLCFPDQPSGGALCFRGFRKLGVGGEPPAPSGGGNCQFLGSGRVCWSGVNGQGCVNSNASASDWKTSSGRNTLCSRARTAYLNVAKAASLSRYKSEEKYISPITRKAITGFAESYATERLSIA